MPTGVKLDEIQPSRIAIRIEAVEEKEITVKAETYGEVPEGYEIYSETITPTKIRFADRYLYPDAELQFRPRRIDLRIAPTTLRSSRFPSALLIQSARHRNTVVDVGFRIGEKRVERVYSVPVDGGRRATVVLFGGRSYSMTYAPKTCM
jgi:hypothetical protein